MKPGGTDGGVLKFFGGIALAILAIWLFFDSVRVTTWGPGWISGGLRGGMGETASGAIIFVPLVLGLILLFFNARMTPGWILTGLGLVILIIEMLSRIQFAMNMKTTKFLILVVMFAAGVGMMLRGYLEDRNASRVGGS